MLVALEKVSNINNGIIILSKQYPKDSVRLFENFLVKPTGELVLEKDGSLPKRITFLGHCGLSNKKKYSNFTAEAFVQGLTQQIEAAAKINPQIKTSLTEIDLLGCHVGFISKETGNSLAEDISNKLKQAGYTITVRAISNRGLKDSESWHSMILTTSREHAQFGVKAFKSKKDKEKYHEFRNQKLAANTEKYKWLLNSRIQECTIRVVVPSNDIRSVLDQNPNFNFTQAIDKKEENKEVLKESIDSKETHDIAINKSFRLN